MKRNIADRSDIYQYRGDVPTGTSVFSMYQGLSIGHYSMPAGVEYKNLPEGIKPHKQLFVLGINSITAYPSVIISDNDRAWMSVEGYWVLLVTN